ncbi:MAG: hypothetical protein AAF004_09550 [Pseudomonadota bacterium]
MKRPGFAQGVVVAAVLGVIASTMVAALTPFVGFGGVIRIVIPVLSIAYLCYVLHSGGETLGRVTTLTLWTAMAVSAWWLHLPLALYVLLHIVAVWIVRSLYCHSSVIPALIDLLLNALSGCAAVWAISRTGSVFLATWSFFLLQALFVAIPRSVTSRRTVSDETSDSNDAFAAAARDAERALQQLFNH